MSQPIYKHPLLIAYIIVSIAHLIGEQIQLESLILYTKPLLMPLLALWLWQQTQAERGVVRPFLILGLLFSCGLGSFLIAQLCYVVAFVK